MAIACTHGARGDRRSAMSTRWAALAVHPARGHCGHTPSPERAREARLKVERTGLKTYTHIAETKDGKRIRTRVGPFATRAEADKAADKIKALGLPVSVLTL